MPEPSFGYRPATPAYTPPPTIRAGAECLMPTLQALAERVDRLLLRHEELKRTNVLLEQQLALVTAERDGMKTRLTAARARLDALLERLPPNDNDVSRSEPS